MKSVKVNPQVPASVIATDSSLATLRDSFKATYGDAAMLFTQWLYGVAGRMLTKRNRRSHGRLSEVRWFSREIQTASTWLAATTRTTAACDVAWFTECLEDRALLVAGTFAFALGSSSASEATATRTVNVTLSTDAALGAGETMSIDVNLGTGNTATGGGVDYSYTNTTLTFDSTDVTGAGTFTKSVTVTVTNDTLLEGSELVNLDLANAAAIGGTNTAMTGSPSTHALTIGDDESATLDIATTSSVTEAGGAQPVGVVTLTITGTGTGTFALGSGISITADRTQIGGTATSGADYTAFGTQTLTFNSGAITGSTQVTTLTVTEDVLLEGSETVLLTLGNLGGSSVSKTLGITSNTTTISDNENATLDIATTSSVTEAGGAQPVGVVTLTITGTGTGTFALGSGISITADRTQTGGTATSGADYTAFGTQTLTFNSGAITGSTQVTTLTVTEDVLLEGSETVLLTLGNLGGSVVSKSLGNTANTTTISDNESATLDIATTSSVTEAGGAQPVGVVTLTIAGTGTGTFALGGGISITANVTKTGGTATSGTDYSAFGTQTVTFNGGAATGATRNTTLTVINDRRLEGNETVLLTLGNLGGSSVAKSLGNTANTTTIADDEIGVIDFQADQSNSENVDPTIGAILTITATGSGTVGLDRILTVVASEAGGGTATQNVDYVAFGPATLTFSVGNANGSNQVLSNTATLDVINDRRSKEGSETVNFSLGSLSSTLNGTTSLGDTTHTATIVDNDSITVSGAATVNEASTYSLVVTVNVDPGLDGTTSFTVNWGDGLSNTYNSSGTKTHVYTDGMPTVRNVTVDLTEPAGTYLDQANTFSLTVLNVAPTLDVSYGPVTYTGTQLQSLISNGVASAPSGTRVLTGSRLDFTGTVDTGILFRLPLTPAGRMTSANSITFTATADWDNLSADADLGFAITDGTSVVGGNFGQTSATNSFFWLEQGTDAGNRVNPVSYPNVANIARSMPFTVAVAVAPTGVTVRGTNNVGATFLYNTTATLNLANSLSLLITSDNVAESYGIKSLFVQAVGSSGVFTNSGPINEGSSGTVFFSTVPFDPSPEDRAAPLKYSYDFDNNGTWDVGDGTYAGGVLASSVSIPASFNDGNITRPVRGRVMDKDFAFDADPSDNFSDYVTNVVINNVAPTIALTGNANVNEGSSYTLNLGAITDPGQDTVTAYSINWGDGITNNFSGNPTGAMPSHTFADGSSTPTITVSLTDEDGTFVGGTKTITVNNVAPTIAVSGAASVNEGSTYTLTLGAITDPGTDTVTFYAVNWGDGAVTSAYTNPTGLMPTHVYADGPAIRTITVTLADEDGTHLSAGSMMVTVDNVAPTIALIGNSSVPQGSIYTLALGPSAIDPGQDTVSAFSINWGDGVTEIFTGLPNNVVKTHLYPNSVASYTITVSLTDEDGTYPAAGTKMVSVTALVPAVSLSGNATTNEGSAYTLSMGAVTNAGTVTAYSINWGDGVTDNFSGSPANTNKTHTYADGAAAGTPRTITVSVTNGSGTYSAGTLGITVNNVAPTIALTGTGVATVGAAYSLGLGAITDPGTDTVTGYSINWGDSTIDTFAGSPVGLTKMHTYASAATFTVTVSLTDEDGTFTSGTQSVTVSVVPTPPVGFGPFSYNGTQLNALLTSGGATNPSGTKVLTGSRLDITGTVLEGIVYRLPLFAAGTFTAANSVTFTTTVDWTKLTTDNDFGIGITDGVKVVAGQEDDDSTFWLEQGTFATDRLTGVAYPAVANLARTIPFTVTITVTPNGIKVRGTNAAGDTFQHTSSSTINLANPLSLVLLSNSIGEKYGINSLTVQAVQAGSSVTAGELLVNGTGANDSIVVRKSPDGTQVIVDSNYNGGATISSSFAIGSITSVRMLLGTGDDKAFVRGNGSPWTIPSTINGDDGNDLLVGADGNDTINGGRGKDVIIGGAGADSLDGGVGDDLLISGTTSYDTNTTALSAFVAEWTSAASYATRLVDLQNGTGAAAGYKLNGNAGVTQTVFADLSVDTLTGGSDTDAFWANLVLDNGGALDVITDQAIGTESAFDIDL